jgi:hypothetical protein
MDSKLMILTLEEVHFVPLRPEKSLLLEALAQAAARSVKTGRCQSSSHAR